MHMQNMWQGGQFCSVVRPMTTMPLRVLMVMQARQVFLAESTVSARERARAPQTASERAIEREREKETDAHGIMQAKNGAGERKTACAIAMLVCVRGKRWGRRKSKDGGQRCRCIVQLPAWCRLMLAAHPAAPILRAVSLAVQTRRKLNAVRSKWKRGTGWQQQAPVEQVELLSAAAGLA